MSQLHTLIIAEAGVNHNGDLELAKRLIEAAASAGADLVKFQTFTASRLASAGAKKAEYQNTTTDAQESQLVMLERLELTEAMHRELIEHCKSCGVGFFSTGFDTQSVDFLISLGVETIKIPSGELTNLPYLRHIGSLGKSVIMSTGMASIGDIEAALEVLESNGLERKHVTVLHCNTEYPTPMVDVNLKAMCNIGKSLGVKYGYSDHTSGIEVAIAAVALGAEIIEKHFTLDRNLPGPDHKASLEPDELRLMVRSIRNIEVAIGDGVKRPTPSETKNKAIARRSIVASRVINKGDLFSADNLTAKRPGNGISPMRWDEVIGRVACRSFSADELIEL